jgi:nitrite reductase/ring-hydroxylating ferredoxin subunit
MAAMGEGPQQTLRRTAQATGNDVSLWYRRDVFSAAGWAGLFVAIMTGLLGFVRYMFPRVRFEPPTTFRAGAPDEYAVGAVNEKFKRDQRVWIVRKEDGNFYALLAICTHLGCTPNWFAIENKFKCPCHGSGFYRDGTNFEQRCTWPLLVLIGMTLLQGLASAHGLEGGEAALASVDPELFGGWQVWVHLVAQWAHLLGLPLWLGVLVAACVFRVLALETLLFAGWAVLLLQGITGAYNMEYSAGIATAPSLLQWHLVAAYDFGRSYTALLGIKQGLYGLAVLVMLLVTALHLRQGGEVNRTWLRRFYLAAQIPLGILITLATMGVLLLHEAADLAPTPVHALGGVVAPDGQAVSPAAEALPEPYRSHALTSVAAGWHLLRQPGVLLDATSRFAHLLGFSLWLGAVAVATAHPTIPLKAFLEYSWLCLGVQLLSGVVQMAVATPFALPPYIWNLEALHHVPFGWTYTALMAMKHGLVLGIVGVTGLLTLRYRATARGKDVSKGTTGRWLYAANLAMGLAIVWVMIMLLLVHEGVDHAL